MGDEEGFAERVVTVGALADAMDADDGQGPPDEKREMAADASYHQKDER